MSATGKRVFVVGGETPTGRGIAVGLAEAGADVAITSLVEGSQADFAINSALNEVWAIGRKGVALAIDASNDEALLGAFKRSETELGRIDVTIAITSDIDAARLRTVLADRNVLAVAPEADAKAALAEVLAAL